MASKFAGIETDLYYIDSIESFICSHGEPCSGESLEDLVLSLKENNRKYFWLDFKNSDDSLVVSKSASLLQQKLQKLKILERTIVETRNPVFIDSLTAYGLYSSYWIPHYYDKTPPYSDKQIKDSVETVLSMHKPTVLSASYEMFYFLKNNFPDEFLHLWTNGLISEGDKAVIEEFKNYQNTKVILVDYDDPF